MLCELPWLSNAKDYLAPAQHITSSIEASCVVCCDACISGLQGVQSMRPLTRCKRNGHTVLLEAWACGQSGV